MTPAVMEAATGVSLLAVPSRFAQLLLGAPLEAPAALTVARVAGAALFALGIACWLAASDARSCAARGVVSAMVIYNLGAAIILGLAGIQGPPAGIALWPAVILHVGMTAWCVTKLLAQPNLPNPTG
jgi:quinol-cytochrome oxidoreductase complex cytochrome b subunit